MNPTFQDWMHAAATVAFEELTQTPIVPQTTAPSASTTGETPTGMMTTCDTTACDGTTCGRAACDAVTGATADWVAEIPLRRDDAAPGRLQLRMAQDTLATLAARYLPPGTTLEEELLADTLGEFANVIAGQLKTMLKGTPHHFQLGTPRTGSAVPPDSGTWHEQQFTCDAGMIRLRLQLT